MYLFYILGSTSQYSCNSGKTTLLKWYVSVWSACALTNYAQMKANYGIATLGYLIITVYTGQQLISSQINVSCSFVITLSHPHPPLFAYKAPFTLAYHPFAVIICFVLIPLIPPVMANAHSIHSSFLGSVGILPSYCKIPRKWCSIILNHQSIVWIISYGFE